jgi:hypothetical protein
MLLTEENQEAQLHKIGNKSGGSPLRQKTSLHISPPIFNRLGDLP